MAFPFGSSTRRRQPRMLARPEAHDARGSGLPLPLTRPRRRALLEPLEPRILLSAEDGITGIMAAATSGFNAIYQEMVDLFENNDVFNNYVPGFLDSRVENGEVLTQSPTVGQALELSVDVLAPGDDTPANNPDSTFGTGITGSDSLENRYQYLRTTLSDLYDTTPAIPNKELLFDEWALDVMDINEDGFVSGAESFAVLVLGQIDYLIDNQDFVDTDGEDGVEPGEVAVQLDSYLEFLGFDVTSAIVSPLEPWGLPGFIQDMFSISVDSLLSIANGDISFGLDLTFSVTRAAQVDLGYQADDLDIAVDPGNPPSGDTLPAPDPTKVMVTRSLDFNPLVFGFNDATDGTVSSGNFYFAVPDMSVAVDIGSPGNPVSVDGMEVNVGFLGTTVNDSGPDEGFMLDMDALGFADDPSNPDALGFNSLPATSGTGTLFANSAPESLTENSDPADDYHLVNDIIFTLRIGTQSYSPVTEITVAATSGPSSMADLAAHVEAAIDAFLGDASLIDVGNIVNLMSINLVDTDPGELGFGSEAAGNGSITATAAPPQVGRTYLASDPPDIQQFSFLLSLGDGFGLTAGLPKLVTVTTEPKTFNNNGTLLDPTDDYYELTESDFQDQVQNALDAAFGAGVVTASFVGGHLRLSAAGTLEITNTLRMDNVEEITLAELTTNAQVFSLEPDPNASFTVDLTLETDSGLRNTVTDAPFEPVGSISVDIDPFDQPEEGLLSDLITTSYDLVPVVIDQDGNASDDVIKPAFGLTFGGDMDPTMLDFNVLGVPEILGLIGDIGNWLERVVATDLFAAFDLPFADASLSDFLAFKDMVIDTLILDDKDDGRAGDSNDEAKLLKWVNVPGSDDQQLVPMFGNAQELEQRLIAILDTFITGDATDAHDYIDARYDTINDELKYNLSLRHLLTPETGPVDPGDTEAKLQFPMDFELDLAPLANIVTDATVKIQAGGIFDFTFGVKMGDDVAPLDDATQLSSLNDDEGVELNTNLALTTVGEIVPVVGRLSGNAIFNVTWTTTGNVTHSQAVTVFKSSTTANETFQDLLDDINAALEAAGVHTAGTGIVADASHVSGTDDSDTGRIVLRATDPDIQYFSVSASSGNVAYTELGFQNERAATVHLVAPNPLGPPVPGAQIDFTLHIQRDAGGALEDIPVYVLTSPSGDNKSWTDNNNVLNDLVDDVNAALAFAGLAGDIVASRAGTHLVLSAINENIRGFTVTDGDNDAAGLGLVDSDGQNLLAALGVDKAHIDNSLVGGIVLRGQDAPSDPFGRLANDISFDLNGVNIALDADDTASNSSVVDLVRDINEVINGNGTLQGRIIAENDGFHIQFRSLDPTIGRIVVDNYSGANAAAQLGIAAGLSSGGSDTDADLTLIANQLAPVSYGVVDNAMFNNASFDVSYTFDDPGDLLPAETRTWTATVLAADTITNRSIFDLAADINQAMNAGFIAAYPSLTIDDNPLVAVVQGQRIVIGLKTVEGGSDLIADAASGVAEFVSDFSVSAAKDSSAAKYLKLVAYDQFDNSSESNDANHYDLMVVFSNPGVAPMMVDLGSLASGQELDGTIGQLRTLLGSPNLTVDFRSDNSGLRLIDTSGGPFTTAPYFQVIGINGSPAALQLGILGADATQLDIGQYGAGSDGLPDGEIIGARLAEINPLDRLFFENPDLSAVFTVALVDVDNVLDAVIDENSDDAYAEANYGFVGIRLSALSTDQTLYFANAEVPFNASRVDVADLFDSLQDISDLRTHVGLPTVEEVSPGDEEFSLKVSLWPDTLPTSLIDIPSTAKLNFEITSFGMLQDVIGPDPDITLIPATVTLTDTHIEELANFETIEFADLLEGLNTIAEFLGEFGQFGFLGQQIPLLGFSINDVLELSNRFADAIETVSLNPAGGLQLLSQALSQAFGLPESVTADYFTERGIPDPGDLIGFVLDDLDSPGDQKMFRLDLRLPVSFSEGRTIDLDLGTVDFLGGSLPVDLQGAAGLNVTGYLDARLSFGVDLDNPGNVYLYDDDTGLSGAISASASALAFNAALGPMGVFIRDGVVSANVSFGMDDTGSDSSHRILITDPTALVHTDPPEALVFGPNFSAELAATLPVFFPTDSEFLGDIVLDLTGPNALALSSPTFAYPNFDDPSILTLPDFSNIDLSTLNPFGGANIAQLLDTFDFLLQGLQDIIDGDVFGIEMPLIGDQLASGADFIEDVRREILDPMRQYLEQAPDVGLDLIQALLYSLLGPGSGDDGFGNDVMINTPLGMVDLSEFVGLPAGQEIPGLGLLVDYLGGPGSLNPITVDDVIPSAVDTNTDGIEDDFQWLFRLGRNYSPSVDIDFDLGFDALGLDMNTGLDVNVAWDLALGLGLSTADGAFIYVGDHRGAGADEELLITVDVDIPNSSETDLEGRLAFLQLKVDESHDDPDNELENEARGTYFHAQFDVDLFKDMGADDRIGFSELGALEADVNLAADAEVNFDIRVQFNDQILPDTISAILPALDGRFVLDWEYLPDSITDFDFAESLEVIGFRDLRLDMGSFFSDFLGPIVDKIAEVTQPLQPIIDVVTTPIPVLSDLAGQPVTLIDLAAMFGDVKPDMIYAIADIITLVNKIGAVEGDELFLPLGDLTLFEAGAPVPGYTPSEAVSLAQKLRDPAFRLDGSSDEFDLDSFVSGANQLIGGFQDLLAAGQDAAGNPGGDPGATGLSESLYTGTAPAAGDFSFPLFDNPSIALGLLFGQDLPLLEYDLPPFGMDFTMSLEFPIWGPLFARITGGLGITIDLAFGYDTRGVRQFAEGDFKNPLDLIAGLYVNDTDQPGGLGTDVAELTFKGEIFAGASVNLGVGSAGVEGGLILTALFDLFDPDRNGKVYVDELVGNFLYEWNYGDPVLAPLAIFDVGFNVAAQLRAFVEILAFSKTFEITPPITIVEFSIPFEREPFLATERGDGSVVINVGPNAGGRLNGDTRDVNETIFVKSLSESEIAVWSDGPDGFGVGESAAQKYRIGVNDDGERLIVVDAGDGDDMIDLSGVTHDIRVIVNAGAGNDTIIGGQSGNEIRGGLGDDDLTGGAGHDLIFGEGGNDTIHGEAGRDWLFGDFGRVSQVDGTTRFRSFASPDDGDDTIFGGDENSPGDIIFGGGGLDTIFGGDGDDLIFGDGGYFDFDPITGDVPMAGGYVDFSKVTARGEGARDRIQGNAGNDAILGGAGDDYLDGGADSDLISGGTGFDTIYGGSDGDFLFGDYHDDIIFGYRDPVPVPEFTADAGDVGPDGDDYVEGGQGNDYIRGQAGDDTLHGNRGFDIIFGGADNDTIGAGLLMAPWIAPADRIADIEAGGDIIFGGAHNDTIDAGEGSDIVFGDDGLVVYLDFVDTTGLLNHLDIGSRIRTDSTMSHKLIGDGDETVLIDGYETKDDDNPLTADLYVTESDADDGSDHIIGGDGRDIIFGGGSAGDPDAPPVPKDTIFGDFDPAAPPTGPRPTGLDTIIGDGGRVELFGRLFATAQAVSNVTYDGVDHISGNDYGDYIFGGGDEDLIWGFEDPAVGSNEPLGLEEGGVIADNDIILGDNGVIVFDPTESANRIKWIHTTAVALDSGRSDEIYGQFEKDVILGGLNSSQDILVGGLDDDIILGDQGELVFDGQGGELVSFGDPDLDTLDRIRSYEDGLGGGDKISGQQAQDILIGGTGGDEMYGDADGVAQPLSGADDVEDIMLGDNADIYLVAPNGAMGGDLKLALNTAIYYIVTTDTIDPLNTGGADTMSGNAGSDIIAGGVYGDTIYGDRFDENATWMLDGHDIILGDNALLEWLSDGRFGDISGIDIGAENPLLYAKYGTATKDTDLTTLDLITTAQKNSGGRDYIRGDSGNDFIFGGTDADEIYGDDSDLEADTTGGNDLIFGDHGRVYPQFSTLRGAGQDWWDAFNSRNFFAIDTGEMDGGEGDRMWGEEGNDSMLGQQGDDRMWGGGDDDDMTGGHNVSGGYDVLTLPAVEASLFAPIAVPDIDSINDLMDGGAGDDAMAGDNAIMWRRGDDLSPRFRALTADAIYDTDIDSITANINSFADRYLGESDPADAVGRDITLLDHDDDVQATPLGRYGNDAMAGGADSDLMFGQLGNDLMQGDGNIDQAAETELAFIRHRADTTDTGAPSTAGTLYFNIPENEFDADDYMEGNGGSDLMFGGLGQDDIVGGSSSLFGLDDEFKRPDTSDFIFGGVGIAIARNDIGATETEDLAEEDGTTHLITTHVNGHSRDADFIMGDNANVYRLVQGGASGTDPGDLLDEFLDFNYDDGYGIQVIPRAMQQLDYQLGGADYNGGEYVNGAADPDGAGGPMPADNGDADLIHGESGDDVIFGMTGSDVLFGEGQDDDIIGGYGHDWISGGTGQDGILGDDGLILTSRNSADYGEPLYGIGALDGTDRPKYADGDVLDEVIKTPGEIQYAVINLSGQLKKTADLVPFSYDPDWLAMDDEFPDNQDDSPFADDIIFGGLGGDWLHAGSGDDAVSGAEALEHAYVPTFDINGDPDGVLDLGYSQALLPANLHDMNPGNVLAFNPVDLDGQHTNNRLRAGEFFLYDEYDPRRTILLDPDGELYKGDPSVDVEGVDYFQFLLNFDETEGLVRPAGEVPKATGQQTSDYPAVNDDGKDAIFGDLGNDWLVGGTGRDNIYGGWGNDLLNADDDHDGHDDVNDLNDFPDTHPYYEDRAYGGAGRDILIGNTGGDRLIDWVGEYNSYLVPYAPFGQASVSRTLQPFLPEFLYALSAGDGADPTRPDDTGADPLRNGEPDAEMGLVLQKDFAWQAQTGAPADPQAGNIPGGHRDVLRSAGFNDEDSQGFAADIGTWSIQGGKLYVEPTVLGESAVSVWNHDQYLPSYFELTATINPVKPIAGYKANSYIVFDYQSSDDFKFAGLNGSTNKIEIGYHDATGWHVTTSSNLLVKPGKDYNILLAINGTNATIVVNNKDVLTWTFAPRVDVYGLLHNINEGMVGLGADNGRASIDNVRLQVIPPAITLEVSDDFSGPPTLVSAQAGGWSTGGGKLSTSGTPSAPSLATGDLTIGANYLLNLGTRFSTGGAAGMVFDYYAADDFKWVAWSKSSGEVQLGHYTERDGWVVDKSIAMNLNGNVELGLKLKGSTVSVVANNQVALSHAFNAIVTDGQFGLLAMDGNASFDSFTVSTDDPSFAEAMAESEALTAATAGDGIAPALSAAAADAMGAAAMERWSSILGAAPVLFSDLEFVIGDLDGLELARLEGTRITVDADAAGHGWFVDRTPGEDAEFRVRANGGLEANPASPALGRMDLLTAMMHEVGHALGFDHDAPVQGAGSVMATELATGFRAGDFHMPLLVPAESRAPVHRGPMAMPDSGTETTEARPGRGTGPTAWAWDAGADALLQDGMAHNGRLFHYVSMEGGGTSAVSRADWLVRDVAPWLSAETGGGQHLGLAAASKDLFDYESSTASTVHSMIEWNDRQ